MLLLNSMIYNCKKPRFIKEQDASGLLVSLGKKASLSKIPLLGPFLF